MKIEAIGKTELDKLKKLILPMVYEELEDNWVQAGPEGDIYLCLAAFDDDGTAAAALVIELEITGDMNVLSIYTLPGYRRRGLGRELLKRAVIACRQLFIWEEGETEEQVVLKALYRLPKEADIVFEAFLKAAGFTDFVLLDTVDELPVYSAFAQIRFFKE
ncbi:MAG: GNAT family N-acetyltransferase [Lachnospiraceae bacterium]|nr:GNAT family N-acetyltransferase [Lachnospiraceae bacterium]